MPKICIVTNIPVPYRIPIFNIIGKILEDNFLVIYAARKEPNRLWELDDLKFNHIFLEENISEKKDGFNYIHNNKDIIKHLLNFSPDYVITTGFNPTHLYAWLYSKIFFKKHVYWSDGTMFTERHLGLIHKFVRNIVFKTTYSFIGPGNDNKKLYLSYGADENRIFKSHLCIDNQLFLNEKNFGDREFDLMYSGQFTDRKIPHFFVDIVEEVSKRVEHLTLLLIGDGPLKNEILARLNALKNVTYTYPGFVPQQELRGYYSSAKLFLFTTKLDAWGVVANESLASGTPVLVTPFAGVANDLVKHEYNGLVLDVDKQLWSNKIMEILENQQRWHQFSQNAFASVKDFTFDNAAKGICHACDFFRR